MQNLDLSQENRALRQEIAELRKQFTDLFAQKEHMISHEKDVLYTHYLNEVGKDLYTLLCLRTEVAALKMKMQLAQAYVNRGEKPNMTQIQKEVDEKLADYYEQIANQAAQLEAAKQIQFCTDEDSQELKQLYYMLVKRLHPDLHPNQTERDADLFLKVQTAYKTANLAVMREIVLALELKDIEKIEVVTTISVLNEQKNFLQQQIAKIQEQIEYLNAEFPFNFKENLANLEWIKEEKVKNAEAIQQLTEEKTKLQRYLSVIIE